MPRPTEHVNHPFGAPLHISSDVPELATAVEAGLAQYPDLGLRAPMHWHVRVVDDAPGDPAWPRVTADDGDDELVVRCGSAEVRVRHADGTATFALPRSLCAVPDALALLAESVVTSFHVRGGRLQAVHSALVARDGVGLLLRGPSGAGKSTLTYACSRRGMTVVSDDWVYAATDGGADRLAGYPWRIMLTEPAAARFDELADVPMVPHTSEEGHKVRVTPAVDARAVTSAVAAVVLLDPDPTLSLTPADHATAHDRFWAAALPSERQHLAPAWVDALLDRPVHVLRRGPDPDTAAALLDELAASLR
jgi:hypothetical protein